MARGSALIIATLLFMVQWPMVTADSFPHRHRIAMGSVGSKAPSNRKGSRSTSGWPIPRRPMVREL